MAMLRELCRSIVISRGIAEQLAKTRRWQLNAATPGDKQRQIFRQLTRMQLAESRLIAMLSTKLRLLQNEKRTRADARARLLPSRYPPPWLDKDRDEGKQN